MELKEIEGMVKNLEFIQVFTGGCPRTRHNIQKIDGNLFSRQSFGQSWSDQVPETYTGEEIISFLWSERVTERDII